MPNDGPDTTATLYAIIDRLAMEIVANTAFVAKHEAVAVRSFRDALMSNAGMRANAADLELVAWDGIPLTGKPREPMDLEARVVITGAALLASLNPENN